MELIKDLGMEYPTEKSKKKRRFGLYRCLTCGDGFKTMKIAIDAGKSRNCQKCRRDAMGMSGTSQYHIWEQIKQRCDNKNKPEFKYYGGKGITYDEKWNSFIGFWEDMEEGYKQGLSIDRIDSNKNYCKENCRWITRSENTIRAHLGRKKC